MPRDRSIPLYGALLALILCITSLAVEAPWQEVHSVHFTVITDGGESWGREVALRFEQMRSVFAIMLSKERLHESTPLTILAFQNDKSYYQIAPLNHGQPIDAPGFFLHGEDQDFIVLNLSEPSPWRAVAHDFAAMLLSYNYPPAQGWFDQGLADYYSSIQIDSREVEIGGVPPVPYSPADKASSSSFTDTLSRQTWVSLPELFTAKYDSAASRPPIYEAESWIVMHYLLHEKKLPETGSYFGMVLNQHLPVEEAIQKAYEMSAAQLEREVKSYFQLIAPQFAANAGKNAGPAAPTDSGPIDRYPDPVLPDDSLITSKGIPESDARALYAGVQLRIPERRDIALKTLQALATTATEADKRAAVKQQEKTKRVGEDADQLPDNAIGNALAHRFLAWDHIERGEFEESFIEIGDAAALNQRDIWARYYLCVAKFRMAQVKHTEITGLANMLLDLRAILEWNPEMAEAYDLLAQGRNAGGTTSAAMQAARAAITLSPRNESYSFHLAEIYVSSKKWEAADALLQRLKTSSNPQVVTEATDLLVKSGAERKYGVTAKSNAAQPQYEAQKTPFDVLDQDAAKREADEKSHPGGPDKRATKFVKGRLIAVDCSSPPSAVLTVSSDAGMLKLHSNDYRSLLLIGTDDFSCEWRDRQVTVNYKPNNGNDGDLVSLEMR